MKHIKSILTMGAAVLLAFSAAGQSTAAQNPAAKNDKLQAGKLGINSIEVNPSVRSAAAEKGTADSLGRVTEALDAQLISAFNETKKFEVVAWSDLKKIITTSEVNAAAGGTAFSFAGCKYSVVVKVDDFQDFEAITSIPALNKTYAQRQIRVSAVAIIYDNADGSVLKTANIQTSTELIPEQVAPNGGGQRMADAALLGIARELSERIAHRVTDVIFPMRVVAVTGVTVTANRGEAFRYVPGMEFDVFGQGEEMTDPDTGKSLGRVETRVGRVRLISVTPDTSAAQIIEGAIGPGQIDRGAVLRLPGGVVGR